MRACMLPGCSTSRSQKRALNPPRARVIDGCEPSYGGWELNPDLLEEQPECLTAEPLPHLPRRPLTAEATVCSCWMPLGTQSAQMVTGRPMVSLS